MALKTISSAEFSEWIAYDRISPIDLGERLDILMSRSDTLQAEIHRDRKKKSSPYEVMEFMPSWAQPKKPEPGDPDYLMRKLQKITEAMRSW